MIVFDTTFLVDYLDGEPAAQEFLEPKTERPFYTPSLALFEVYRGAETTAGRDGVERLETALDWLDTLPLTNACAREAAVIETELLADGTPINLRDVLIAGVCRHHGAQLVTRDSDFQAIDGLETGRY